MVVSGLQRWRLSQGQCCRRSAVGLGHLPGDAGVGVLYLLICGTRVAELIAGVGVVEVAPDACHVRWDLEVTVLFGCDLEERETETSQTWGRFAVWLKGGQI